MKLISWILRFGPALLVMAVIFYASSIPSAQMPDAGAWDFIVKKGGHMTGYALLAMAFLHAQERFDRRSVLAALFACSLYALSDEFHQSFVAGRNSTLVDVGIDLAGTGIALWLARFNAIRNLVLKH
jgi:VanZ family protein